MVTLLWLDLAAFFIGLAALAGCIVLLVHAARTKRERVFLGWLAAVLVLFVAAIPLYWICNSSWPRRRQALLGCAWVAACVLSLGWMCLEDGGAQFAERGWGGFNAATYRLSDPQKKALGLPLERERKAVKLRVYADTPLAEAGLAKDDVVFGVDDRGVYTAADLLDIFNAARPGTVLRLRYFPAGRAGQIRETDVTVGRERYRAGQRSFEFRPALPFVETGVNSIHLQIADFHRSSRKHGLQLANLWGLDLNTGRLRVLEPIAPEPSQPRLHPAAAGARRARAWRSEEPQGRFQYTWRLKLPWVHVLGGERIVGQQVVHALEGTRERALDER